jgi:anti-sigma regulatory factor (Ser/Thr protein kinase)
MSAGDHLEVSLAQNREAPRRARDHLGLFLDAHSYDAQVRDEARLIVTELVTNAVVHAVEPITLEVAVRDTTLRLAVRDGDDRTAVIAAGQANGDGMTGRGLAIIEAFSHRWGVRSHRGGKSVWAEIHAP